jgi:inorganic phosphate transporter, PiT family
MHQTGMLVLVVATALVFDFTNGFHDTANAMATTISTGALKPRIAVVLSGVLNFIGAFLTLSVAATIAKGIISQSSVTLDVVFAGLVGGILWNVVTWYLGAPSSSSHALIGGVVGAMLVHAGSSAVEWSGIMSKVIIPALFSPFIAGAIAAAATWIALRMAKKADDRAKKQGFKWAQVGSASLVSLAHGTNDAQKTMGVITLALVANGSLAKSGTTPNWVIVSCGLAIGLGTYFGGWRIIRTVGKGLTEIDSPQGFAAQTTTAAVLLSSTHFGFPLSTTQVSTGSVVGSGLGHRFPVRWVVFGRMVGIWILTLPAAAGIGAACFAAQQGIGGSLGVAILAIVLAAICAAIFVAARRNAVNPDNVNEEWEAPGEFPSGQHLAV